MTTEFLLEKLQAKAVQINDTYKRNIGMVVRDMSDSKKYGFDFLFSQSRKSASVEGLYPFTKAKLVAECPSDTVFEQIAHGQLPVDAGIQQLSQMLDAVPTRVLIDASTHYLKTNDAFESMEKESTNTSKPSF